LNEDVFLPIADQIFALFDLSLANKEEPSIDLKYLQHLKIN